MRNSKINFKVIILAGGKGSRLGEITKKIPKPLIQVHKKEFINYLIEYFEKIGINDFIITTSYKSNFFKRYIKKYKNKSSKFKIINEKKPLGTGGSLINAIKKEKLNLNIFFILCNADTLLLYNIRNIYNLIQKKKNILLVIKKKNCKRYGYIEMKKNKLISIKRNVNKSGYISSGFFIFKSKIFDKFKKNKNSNFEQDIIPKITELGNEIYCHKVNKPFIDIGIKKDLKKSKFFIKKKYYEFIKKL